MKAFAAAVLIVALGASGFASAQDALPAGNRPSGAHAPAEAIPVTDPKPMRTGRSVSRAKSADGSGTDVGDSQATPRICTNCDD